MSRFGRSGEVFMREVQNVMLSFQSQVVYCPQKKKLTYLNQEEVSDADDKKKYIGQMFDKY